MNNRHAGRFNPLLPQGNRRSRRFAGQPPIAEEVSNNTGRHHSPPIETPEARQARIKAENEKKKKEYNKKLDELEEKRHELDEGWNKAFHLHYLEEYRDAFRAYPFIRFSDDEEAINLLSMNATDFYRIFETLQMTNRAMTREDVFHFLSYRKNLDKIYEEDFIQHQIDNMPENEKEVIDAGCDRHHKYWDLFRRNTLHLNVYTKVMEAIYRQKQAYLFQKMVKPGPSVRFKDKERFNSDLQYARDHLPGLQKLKQYKLWLPHDPDHDRNDQWWTWCKDF